MAKRIVRAATRKPISDEAKEIAYRVNRLPKTEQRKLARMAERGKAASTSHRPVLRNFSNEEMAELAKPYPWPVRDRKGNRTARKALANAMDEIADQACHLAFNASFAESMRLKYPRQSSGHFLRMFFRAMNKHISERMRGAGVRP